MGVGISAFVLSLIVVIMITPLAHSLEDDLQSQEFLDNENRYLSYEEKHEKELARLLTEWELKEPRDGGPHGIELVDFQKLAEDELVILNTEMVELQTNIDKIKSDIRSQKEIISKEEIKITRSQEKVQEEWGAKPVDTTQLKIYYKKLADINVTLGHLLIQQEQLEKKIELKKLLLEIHMYDAKLIGVRLSTNCITMNKLDQHPDFEFTTQYESNMTNAEWSMELEKIKQNYSTCPTYKDLLSLDSSNKEISGEFSMYDGYFHREQSDFVDSHQFYDTDDTIRIIIDPHYELASRIKMITIESNFGFYTTAYDRDLDGDSRTLSKDRMIDNCYNATISTANWKMLLPDTVFTFRNGCTSAEIVDQVKYKMPYTVIDKSTSPNIQYQEWLKETKNNCKVKC